MNNAKLSSCCDCNIKLTDKNRSKLQPDIRCEKCCVKFCKTTTVFFENLSNELRRGINE